MSGGGYLNDEDRNLIESRFGDNVHAFNVGRSYLVIGPDGPHGRRAWLVAAPDLYDPNKWDPDEYVVGGSKNGLFIYRDGIMLCTPGEYVERIKWGKKCDKALRVGERRNRWYWRVFYAPLMAMSHLNMWRARRALQKKTPSHMKWGGDHGPNETCLECDA